MRAHELAKELQVDSQVLVEKLRELGVGINNRLAAVSKSQADMARAAFAKAAPAPAPAPAPVSAPVAAPPPPVQPVKPPEPARPAPAVRSPIVPISNPVRTVPTPIVPLSKPAKPAYAAMYTPKVETPKPPAAAAAAPAAGPSAPAPDASGVKTIAMQTPIVVRDFAEKLGIKPNQLITELMTMNVFASINEKIDFKLAEKIAEKRGYKLEHERKPEHKPVEQKPAAAPVERVEDRPEELLPRPPVVTFMGHVDHGKTSLLDKIRNARVAAGEAGGITQHVGAYTVAFRDHQITFLDTPGHAAFTAMRARGANLTDIAVLVVDAVDGIMAQTKEALQHAKAANVCIMVALNKIDLPAANVDRVKRQLQQEGLAPEDWGGTTICCPVSALSGEGIDHLLEMILLQAEVLELKANPARKAEGYVIEARMEPGMGPTANVLVKRGTLRVGDPLLCGPYWGKVKALVNDKGAQVRTAGPSMPVKIMGLTAVPEPGMELKAVADEKEARETSERILAEERLKDLSATPARRLTIDDLLRKPQEQEQQTMALVIKTDVQGSLEAIEHSLKGIKSDKIALNVALAGVGNVTANDILLARASSAIVVGFHVGIESGVADVAKQEGVEVRLYSIIYELIDEVRDAMTGLLEPKLRQVVTGQAEVRQVFELTKKGKVAGCIVRSGRVTSRSRVRVKRAGAVVFEGALVSLKRFQNDASEVREGQECGLRIDKFTDYQPGDILECFEIEKTAQQL